MSTRLHLFQGYGIELEYMIVNKHSLAIMPITDELFKSVTGKYTSDVNNGKITWSNELVLHVLELKSSKPESDLLETAGLFHENVKMVNGGLKNFDARLMPGAAHPLMDPAVETRLWPHDSHEIYEAYNRIFNCRGHGWSNVQSTHINLPFYDDEEFARLHAAVRLILPILPAIAASSPVLGGKNSGFLDKRLDYYQKNQRSVPSVTGRVIPERAFSKRQYHKMIYDKIAHDIAPHDPQKILEPVWLNSRGAIARFDRGSIEIRLLDIQECPQADMAIVALIVCLSKMLVFEHFIPFKEQQKWDIEPLHQILQKTIREAENTIIDNEEYLKIFKIDGEVKAKTLWKHIIDQALQCFPQEMKPWMPQLDRIIHQGTLASRITRSLGDVYAADNIAMAYREMSDCLMYNEMFETCMEEKL